MSGSSRGSSEMNRNSIDRRSSLENGGRVNGLDKTAASQRSDSRSKLHSRSDSSTMEELRQQLEKMRVEKEESEANYRTLLERLSEMKSKIGLKIQQDAEELERRETAINTLTAQNDDLQNAIASLHSELSSTNAESERVTKELDTLRNTLQQHQQSSTMAHSTQISALTSEAHTLRDQLKESQELLERARLEKEEWERILMDERVSSEALRTENRTLKRDSENERMKREKFHQELEQERQRADNLEAVLAEFEA
ncbi:1660_t:CDS:2, partial [Acaulospora colombiana]